MNTTTQTTSQLTLDPFPKRSLPQPQVSPDGLTRFLPLSTNLLSKNERKMLYFPTEFGELNMDGLIVTGAL